MKLSQHQKQTLNIINSKLSFLVTDLKLLVSGL